MRNKLPENFHHNATAQHTNSPNASHFTFLFYYFFYLFNIILSTSLDLKSISHRRKNIVQSQ